ncbi:unnamed protein product [Ilex paraguariensis]|uniref:Uncharacterized protein n=1 Tax=Ilex paraguariensis TaxID=185542 RepID=A0ABC8TV83_9AQUA
MVAAATIIGEENCPMTPRTVPTGNRSLAKDVILSESSHTVSSKTWSDIWTKDLEDLLTTKEKIDWKGGDVKNQKFQKLVDLCRKYGVVPQLRTERGYPLRLVVVEQITTLHPTLIVFDRHHDRKDIEYYAEKVPCNMVILNDDGEVDMIKGRSHIDDVENTPGGESSSSSWAQSPVVLMFTENLQKLLRKNGHHDRKDIEYYAEKVPCNMVILNDDGEVDMIKGRSHIDDVENTPGGESSSSSWAQSPVVLMFTENLQKLLRKNG